MSRLTGRFGTDSHGFDRDDGVLPVTRWTGRIIAPILVVAFLILYGFPGRTTDLFAWTIDPPMTALVMGAGYGTGVYFFYRVVTVDEWHRVGAVFPGIAVYTVFMAAATVLHWENFNHDHVTFWAWTFLYAVSPIVITAVWIRNNRTDPRATEGPERSRLLPLTVRWVSVASGLVIVVVAVLLFAVPEVLIENWPWNVSPLTARVLLGWFALFGVVNLTVGLDRRWSAARIAVQTQVIGFSLMLLGAVRSWEDFDAANPFTWAFLGGFVVYLLALVFLYYAMERR